MMVDKTETLEELRTGGQGTAADTARLDSNDAMDFGHVRRLRAGVEKWSLVTLFGITILIFSVLRIETFPTWENARSILDQSSAMIVLACGLTVVLVLREFDLSVGAVIGASAATAVVLMSHHGASSGIAILAAVAVGAVFGLLNGFLVAYLGTPSFIATLAVGSIVAGVELAFTDTTIFEGLRPSYLSLTTGRLFGQVPIPIVIAAGTAVVLGTVLRFSVFGRYATAAGDNFAAARIAGVRTTHVRIAAFVIAGMCAALAGILLSSRAAAYYPGSGPGLLLPAYAACFLGLALGGGWRFNVLGTYVGVVFLGTVTTGLTMLNQPTWIASIIQGCILLAAVVALMRRGSAWQ
jgi:ribose/xylose/arabinose/galactoside ABC-type transport system permease subunit